MFTKFTVDEATSTALIMETGITLAFSLLLVLLSRLTAHPTCPPAKTFHKFGFENKLLFHCTLIDAKADLILYSCVQE